MILPKAFTFLLIYLSQREDNISSHGSLYIGELQKFWYFLFFSCDGIIKGLIATKTKLGGKHSILLI
jgi:hypothetical protein